MTSTCNGIVDGLTLKFYNEKGGKIVVFNNEFRFQDDADNWVIRASYSRNNTSITPAFEPYASGMTLGSSFYKWSAIYASTSTITTSDKNAKDKITPVDMVLAEKLADKLEPVTYVLKDGESGRTHYGMIAQQIEEVMQELGIDSLDFAPFIKSPVMEDIYGDAVDEDGNVILGGDGEPLQVVVKQKATVEYTYMLRYEELYAILWRAFQAKSERIRELEETVQNQQEKIGSLEERISKLESLLGQQTAV